MVKFYHTIFYNQSHHQCQLLSPVFSEVLPYTPPTPACTITGTHHGYTLFIIGANLYSIHHPSATFLLQISLFPFHSHPSLSLGQGISPFPMTLPPSLFSSHPPRKSWNCKTQLKHNHHQSITMSSGNMY